MVSTTSGETERELEIEKTMVIARKRYKER